VNGARGAALARSAALAATTVLIFACGKRPIGGAATGSSPSIASAPSVAAPGAPRPGMAWIPAGLLRAGSAPDDVPRVADAELPGVDVPMAGFYIDVLPWPDEAGAIPTTNVTRDEAKRLCGDRSKRLCSELEWERACKGPDNERYEYGDRYDARACGAGVAADVASRRPSGQRPECRSAFGVADMHAGASEWTDSKWGRGTHGDLGVVRGGSDAAGERVTRCAFGFALPPADRSPVTGFRCCAGPRNDASVNLEVHVGPVFERVSSTFRVRSPPLDALSGVACGPPSAPAPCSVARAWMWRPGPNIELTLSGGCVGRDPNARCSIGVSRMAGDGLQTLAQVDTGQSIPEVVLVESQDRRVRVRGGDTHGWFFREVAFSYGHVDVRTVH
jgi:formylglycine-generating enzyme required for sulfatase activity